MLMDYHLHSSFSGDGHDSVEGICAAARARGLTHIALTDHHDIGHSKYDIHDVGKYAEEVRRVRALFPEIDIACGMEMDYRPETWAEMRKIPERYGLDFGLLSLHYVDGVDPYKPKFFDGRSQMEGYCLYLRLLARMIEETEGPWVLAHITYVSKFARFEDAALRYADYAGELDAVLRLAVARGYGIEANTSGMRGGAGMLPGEDTLRRFRELGGRIVTVGSDAHSAGLVGDGIAEAQQAVKAAGFGHLSTFKERKPYFIKID
jgi:histidinol-phosphatase (PHP family)